MERLARLEWLASVASELSIKDKAVERIPQMGYLCMPGGHFCGRTSSNAVSSELRRITLPETVWKVSVQVEWHDFC